MENQSDITASQPIIDLVTQISIAYENLGIGPFTDEVYKELISIDIHSIEARYQNKNEILTNQYRFDGLHNMEVRHQDSLDFNELEKLMPAFRLLIVDNELPADLDNIISSDLHA